MSRRCEGAVYSDCWNRTQITELPNRREAIRLVDGQAVYIEGDCISLW